MNVHDDGEDQASENGEWESASALDDVLSVNGGVESEISSVNGAWESGAASAKSHCICGYREGRWVAGARAVQTQLG